MATMIQEDVWSSMVPFPMLAIIIVTITDQPVQHVPDLHPPIPVTLRRLLRLRDLIPTAVSVRRVRPAVV